MSMTLKLNIVQNSQNVTGNSSNVTVSATATWDARHWNASGLCTGSITIDGTTYSFSGMSFNTNATSSGSQTVMTKTVDVKHLENGSKTLVCSASFDTRVSVGVISASASKNLTTIARKATLTETPSLTLGEKGTLKISRASQDIRRLVTYSCGNTSGCILNETRHISTSSPEGAVASGDVTNIYWTPLLSLASVDPTSDYANITLTVHSYFDDGQSDDGSTSKDLGINTYYIKAHVPSSVGPKITSVTVTENHYSNAIGQLVDKHWGTAYDYLQGVSILNVKIAADGDGCGSTITEQKYSTTIGGVTYSGSEFTITDTSKLSGDITITTTVTDNRGSSGRTASYTQTVKFAPYTKTKITDFTAVRANSDGTENSNGKYILCKVSGTTQPELPVGEYYLYYRKAGDPEWIYADDDNLELINGTFDTTFNPIGQVDEYRYELKIEITDRITETPIFLKTSTISQNTSGELAENEMTSTGEQVYKWTSADYRHSGYYCIVEEDGVSVYYEVINTHIYTFATTQIIEAPGTAPIMHFNKSGNGIGFGRVAELPNVFDIGFKTKFTGGILYPTLEAGTDLNTVLTPNTYSGLDQSSANYLNCPLTQGSFTLEVKSAGADGQLSQRLTRCHKTQPVVYERFYYNDAWGEWFGDWITVTADKLGENFAAYGNNSNHLPRYRKDGRVVEINGQLTFTKTITYSTTGIDMFTLPEGYRPARTIHTLCQGSGTGVWFLSVDSNGTVQLARYRYGDNETTTAGVNTWLPFQLTFLV